MVTAGLNNETSGDFGMYELAKIQRTGRNLNRKTFKIRICYFTKSTKPQC